MTRCSECDVVNLGISRVVRNDEEFQLCPNCGAEDSVEEVNELNWQEDPDFQNELDKE